MRATKKMTSSCNEEENDQLRRGPWTLEEDNLLISYITCHGEGRWNSLAKSSGLKRTGKSCRLRWLNYLKPDIKRGNLTPQEQLLILELHSKWGNRWSKIAQHLPGRTDNEIKNYWRTRVQKQARHLKIDSNSKRFVDALRRFWMPRLLEKVEQTSSSSASASASASLSSASMDSDEKSLIPPPLPVSKQVLVTVSPPQPSKTDNINSSSSICSSDSMGMLLPELPQNSQPQTSPYNGDTAAYYNSSLQNNDCYHVDISNFDMMGFNQSEMQALGPSDVSASDFQVAEDDWIYDDMAAGGTFWNIDELWQFRK